MPNDPGDIESITLSGLLEQEAQARSHGSGIQATALLGNGPPNGFGAKGKSTRARAKPSCCNG